MTNIKFIQTTDTGRTKVWAVVSTHGDIALGEVRWFGRWRQYCCFPDSDTLYSHDCLREIADFIEAEMLKRKEAKP